VWRLGRGVVVQCRWARSTDLRVTSMWQSAILSASRSQCTPGALATARWAARRHLFPSDDMSAAGHGSAASIFIVDYGVGNAGPISRPRSARAAHHLHVRPACEHHHMFAHWRVSKAVFTLGMC
jgi:hypothetical protein